MGGNQLPGYDPSPHPVYGVIEFVGEFFSHGLACGAAFHAIRVLRGSPRGARRLADVVHAVSTHAPRVAGRFGAYCAAYSAVEGGVCLARRREDEYSTVMAGALFWGLDGMRRGGAPAAVRGALLGVAGVTALAEVFHTATTWYSTKVMNGAHPVPIGAPRGDAMDEDCE